MGRVNLQCPWSAGWQTQHEEGSITNGNRSHESDAMRKQPGMEFQKCESASKIVQLLHHVFTGVMPKDKPNL